MREIARTALWVAGMRAIESERKDPLFRDPFARRLAGDAFVEDLRRHNAGDSATPSAIAVRTRWLDEQIALGVGRGIGQVVIVAAGMDARAYRLTFPTGTRLFELDHSDVLQDKEMKLAGIAPKCERYAVSVDLADDWPAALQTGGFDAEAQTLWLVEGLLVYLPLVQVTRLFSILDALSIPGSVVLFDVVGRSMLESPRVKALHELARQFGTDEPETLLAPFGWRVHAYSTASVGQQLGRWPFPVRPRGTPGFPQAYMVHGLKI